MDLFIELNQHDMQPSLSLRMMHLLRISVNVSFILRMGLSLTTKIQQPLS